MLLAEQLVGEARERRRKRMSRLERIVNAGSAAVFVAVVVAIALLLPNERSADPLLVLGLIAGYALVSRVRFEFGSTYVTPEQLAFIPTLLLLPLPLVPVVVVVAALLGQLPDFVRGTWHHDRWVSAFADSWFCIGPVLVLEWLAPGVPTIGAIGAYAAAFGAQIAGDLAWATLRGRILDSLPFADRVPFRELWRDYAGVARFDAMLTPIAIAVALVAASEPLWLLAIAPIVWMLVTFARERQERYAKALELQRAYRGTVMLLSDVVEFDDQYTADHSRSVVDLTHAVAEELNFDARDRQTLEFAAMLHDVGKIAIPKEILNKPSKLTDAEFDVMKKHTIEGQYMLDRVGGLLGSVGEIVRSCHERWDGKGYPDGLAGEQIPLAARIVFTCDAYNAMTTDRVYRPAMSVEAALAELRENAGSQFDPRVVHALERVIERWEPQHDFAVDDIRKVLADNQVAGRIGATA
ncbi:MAG: HD-GYP domain-containing protein [Solirubrobacterales bacterium]|nr:HD-GYP domain-containing protein [Solirubrobacterales bacterium]